jgi:hypothetical protein
MSERDHDPIASTQMFRAFVHRDDAAPAGRLRPPVMILALIAALAVAAVVAWLIVR